MPDYDESREEMEVRRRAAIDLIGSLAADRRSFETGEKCMEEQIDALRTRVQYLEGVLSSATALAESKALSFDPNPK